MEKCFEQQRCHYIDWLRIVGILCVFLFHNARFFDLIDWDVKNKETFLLPTMLVLFMNFWLMPLFFMLAGIGANFALRYKKKSTYLLERCRRLIIPYIFGIFILIPLQRYVEYIVKGKFAGSFLDFLTWYPEHKLVLVNFGFSPVWFGEIGMHLWFLAFLFIFSVISLPIIEFLKGQRGKSLIKLFYPMSEKVWSIYLFVVPLALIKVLLQPIYPKYSSWADFAFWFLIFVFGYLLFCDKRFVENAERNKWISLGIGSMTFVMLVLIFIFFLDYLRNWWDHPDYSFGCILFHIMWPIASWSWLLFFLGAGKAFLILKMDG